MLKKLLVLSFVLAAGAFALGSVHALEVTIPSGTEVSLGDCTDGVDNDGDSKADENDDDCADVLNLNETSPEDNRTACTDGVDNDGDSKADENDDDCADVLNLNETSPENTLAACTNGLDDDGDSKADENDDDCADVLNLNETSPENTLAACTNGLDDDGDSKADENDDDCADVLNLNETSPEDNRTACTDGVDNDGDSKADENDDDCASFFPGEVTTPVVTERGHGGGGGSSSRPRNQTTNSGNGNGNLPTDPAVLGAATGPNGEMLSCPPYLVTFMRIGQANDVGEVKKLQSFLNESVGSNLPITGFFGPQTHAAVMALHAKHADQILRPWDQAGLSVNLQPTGYAYKMTQWFINSSMCKGTTIPKPDLK